MSWQINGKFILVPKNYTPPPTGTPTGTPASTSTPTPTITSTPTPTPTPLFDGLLMENGEYLLQENTDKIIL
jgi:hypothetical protein